MNAQKISGQSLALLISLSLVVACQAGPGAPAAIEKNETKVAQVASPEDGLVCQPLKMSLNRNATLSLQSTGTQAIVTLPDCSSTAFVRLQVTGLGIESPLYAQGADDEGLLAVDEVCSMSFVLPEIPDGNGRVISFEAFDGEMQPLEDLSYQVVFNLDSNELEVPLNCLTTAVAKIYQATVDLSEVVASHLDLEALTGFVGKILGVAEEPYIFAIDPQFLNHAALAADIVLVGGNLSQLDPSSEMYLQDYGLIQGEIDGLVADDTLVLSLNDPAASELLDMGNGMWLFPAVEPGDWTLTIADSSSNGTRYTVPEPMPVHVDAQGQHDLGLINVVPESPVISSFSEDPIQVGNILYIQGSGFHGDLQGNHVSLDGIPMQLVSASKIELGVLVPRNPGPGHDLQVQVGTQSSNIKDLEISRLRWEIDTDNMLFTTPAIGPDGTLYISTESGRVQAIDPVNGEILWTYEGLTPCYTSPILTESGRVYVLSSSGQVLALKADDGTVIYRTNLSYITFSSPTVDHNDNIYFMTEDNQLVSLNSEGIERWRFQGGSLIIRNSFLISPSPVLGNNEATVFSGSLDGKVYALNADTGAEIWAYDTGSAVYASPVLNSEAQLYLVNFDGFVMAINTLDGQREWTYNTNSRSTSAPILDSLGNIYLGTWKGELIKLSPDGVLIGDKQFSASIESSPVLDQEGRIYLGTSSGWVYVLNPLSFIWEWQFQLPNDVSASLTMDREGLLYLTSRAPGKVIALYSDSFKIMDSDWPKYRNDLGNTGSLGFVAPIF